MGGGDWKDSGYRGLLGRTEDLRTSHTLDALGGRRMTEDLQIIQGNIHSYDGGS